MKADGLLQIAWLIANAEAKDLGVTEIQPVHFLLATMKIIDPNFPVLLDKLNVSSKEWAAMCKEAQSIRHYIDVIPDRVTIKRRSLRARLAQKQLGPSIKKKGLLHRSKSARRAFSDAIFFTDGDTVTLKQLVQSLFEMKLVDLSLVDTSSEVIMSQYSLSMSQNPMLPAWYISEDEGEAWEYGDYICFLQKHPPLQMDAMLAMTKRLPTSSIPPSDPKGFRYLYVLSMFYKKGRNPSGKDTTLPAEVMTIEQVNTAMFSGGTPRWDAPVLCSFKPSGHWNSGRQLPEPVSKDTARATFFDELSRRVLPSPLKIGNISEGMNVLSSVTATPGSDGRTGYLIPLVLAIGSFVAVCITTSFRV